VRIVCKFRHNSGRPRSWLESHSRAAHLPSGLLAKSMGFRLAEGLVRRLAKPVWWLVVISRWPRASDAAPRPLARPARLPSTPGAAVAGG